MAVTEAVASISAQERRLRRTPWMLGVIVALMWLTASAEAQTILPLLHTLTVQYQLTTVESAWVISIISVVSAATLTTLCRAADLWGVRRMLLISLVTIVIGNVLSAIAPGATLFLIGRGIAGFTAATPLLLAVFRLRSETEKHLDTHLGILTAAQGFGLVLSFLLGGIILEAGGSARTAIWVIAVLAVIVAALVWAFVPDSPVRAKVRLDWVGSVLLGVGLALAVVALSEANSWGWGSGSTLGMLVGGVAVLLIWGLWELRVEQPMVDLRAIAGRSSWPAFFSTALIAMLGTCNTLAVSQYVETPSVVGYGFGDSVLLTGAILLPVGVMITGGGTVMAPVIQRIGQRNASVLGAAIACLNFLWFSFAHTQVWEFIIELFVFGVGYALTATAGNSAYMRGARLGESGMVAGAANIVVIGAQALGPTLMITILTASTIAKTPVPQSGNYTHAWLFMAGFALLAALFAALIKNSSINQLLAPNAAVTDVPGNGVLPVEG